MRATSKRARSVVAGLVLATALGGLAAIGAGTQAQAAAPAVATARTTSGNPLAGHPWGVYKGTHDDNKVYQAWLAAQGYNKQMIARIALRARVQWFGAWQSSARINGLVAGYLDTIHADSPDAIAWMAMFPIENWEAAPAKRHWSAAYIADYQKWIRNAAAAIGSNRVAIVLQPDLIYAVQNSKPSVPLSMVRYAAQKFGALPNTSVYLDAGARDYVPPKGVSMVNTLRSAGIQYTRGFSLNDTHHDATSSEIGYGNTLAAGLARAHLPHHFVVNTSSNGRPSTVATLKTYIDAPACSRPRQTRCVALGIPPTSDTTNPHWGLTRTARAIAARLVDGFVWTDRIWMTNQSSGGSYSAQRSVTLGRNTPFVASVAASPTAAVRLGNVPVTRAPRSTRKNIVIINLSHRQNMTIDAVYFRATNAFGRFGNALASTCRPGAIVAPRKSCTATVVFSPLKAGRAATIMHIATNTNAAVSRHVVATVTG